MGFLNNSGDIILDAVLTDTGRMRLSKGDGSFQITKFALADDEIDYSLYNANTGSAYTDLQILQTPVLETFTNNASSMKNKLLTVNLKNLLYMPVLKVNNIQGAGTEYANKMVLNGYIVACDRATESYFSSTSTKFDNTLVKGVLPGFSPRASSRNLRVRIDQGIDSAAIPTISDELKETQYIIEMDNRLGTLTDDSGNPITPSYIDDDDIASYFVSADTDPGSVVYNSVSSTDNTDQGKQVISGPRGTILTFGIEASLSAKTSNYLFQSIGNVYNGNRTASSPSTLYRINSNITITGATTGYTVVVPVAYAKLA